MKNYTETLNLAQKIIKILIESELSVNQQLTVINMVKNRLEFCKKTGAEISQFKLNL